MVEGQRRRSQPMVPPIENGGVLNGFQGQKALLTIFVFLPPTVQPQEAKTTFDLDAVKRQGERRS